MEQSIADDRGINLGVKDRLGDLEYADDICLLSHCYSDTSLMLQRLTKAASKVGLKINIRKTKSMRINPENNNIFTIGNSTIEEVDQFCYLGAVITKTGGSSEDINNRIKKAAQSYGILSKAWKSTIISRRVKIKLFNSNVLSTLLYGCETWNASSRDLQALQSFTNKCLRKILRIFWPQTISNNSLWNATQQAPLAAQIRRRKWNWLGHILRKPPNDIARTAIQWNPQGSRRRGRPAHTWRRQTESEMNNMRKSWSEIKYIALDRSRWRDFVEALCSL